MIRALLLTLLALPLAGGDTRPLRPIDFVAAKRAAASEHKPLLIAFRDADSPDCKKLDTTTWAIKEKKFREWLESKLVTIEIDVDKEPEIAHRMRIRHLPTFVFLDEHASEIDRLFGYRDAHTLKVDGEALLAGGDPLERWKKRISAAPDNPDLRFDYAGFLCDRGTLDDALREYLWCLDNGVKHSADFAAVRNGPLIDEFKRLAQLHPQTLDALTDRITMIEKRLVQGGGTDAEVQDYVTFAHVCGEDERVLKEWDALAQQPSDANTALRERLAPFVRDILYVDRRYDDLFPLLGDVRATFGTRTDAQHALEASLADVKTPDATRKIEAGVKRLREDTARDYECLLGVHKLGDATIIAEKLVAFDGRGPTWVALIQHARRAGSIDEAAIMARRALDNAALTAPDKYDVRKAADGLKLPQ